MGNVCLFIENKGLLLSVYVDHIRMAGKTLMKFVDLGEPTSFLDTCIWDVFNVNASGRRVSLTSIENVRITNFSWSN